MDSPAPLSLMPLKATATPSPAEPVPEGRSWHRRWGWLLVAVLAIAAITRTAADERSPVRREGRSQEVETVGSLATVPSRGGRASVRVSDQSPLVDGTIVEVKGTGFPPDAEVEIRQCVGERACVRLEPVETAGPAGTYRSSFLADGTGTFDARVAVRRFVLVSGKSAPVDCSDGQADHGCDLVTVVYFSNRSLYPNEIPLRFAASGEAPKRPVVVAESTSGLSDSQRIRLAGLGFRPGTEVRPVVCDAATADRCEPLGIEGPAIVGDDSNVLVTVVVNERRGDLDCREPQTCTITLLPEQSGGRALPAGLPVSFLP